MNLSWTDAGQPQQAGEYPFREGTITITHGEVAIWKRNPNTRFQLMRKYPQLTHYVLGREVETPDIERETFYISSNGDTWSLAENPTTGQMEVLHSPNARSGGQQSYSKIDQFLSNANGPEHQALQLLMEKTPAVRATLIAYDMHPPRGEAYDKLVSSIQSLGAWWHHLETTWIVRSVHSHTEILRMLTPLIGSEDQLLVVDLTGSEVACAGVNQSGVDWLGQNVASIRA
jgi:hypothetical protein